MGKGEVSVLIISLKKIRTLTELFNADQASGRLIYSIMKANLVSRNCSCLSHLLRNDLEACQGNRGKKKFNKEAISQVRLSACLPNNQSSTSTSSFCRHN